MTIREKILSVMEPGSWYDRRELTELTGAKHKTMVSTLGRLRRDGELHTRRDAVTQCYSYAKVDREAVRKLRQAGRELSLLEMVPLSEVTRHLPEVGPLDSWRGLVWQDMPGSVEIIKKANFALWRRGLLHYHTLPEVKQMLLRERYGVC